MRGSTLQREGKGRAGTARGRGQAQLRGRGQAQLRGKGTGTAPGTAGQAQLRGRPLSAQPCAQGHVAAHATLCSESPRQKCLIHGQREGDAWLLKKPALKHPCSREMLPHARSGLEHQRFIGRWGWICSAQTCPAPRSTKPRGATRAVPTAPFAQGKPEQRPGHHS